MLTKGGRGAGLTRGQGASGTVAAVVAGCVSRIHGRLRLILELRIPGIWTGIAVTRGTDVKHGLVIRC